MKRRVVAGMLAALMALSLAACGSGSGSSDTAAPSTTDAAEAAASGELQGGKLTVAIWDNNQLAGLQQIANKWAEANGYEVEFQVIGWDSYWTMLEAGVSGGEMPDVFWMHSNNALKYEASGVLLPLNDFIDKDDAIDLSNYFEGITELYTLDGTCYAVPKDHDTIAMVYNKTILDKYGVPYPDDTWTWEDFASAAQKISDEGAADGVFGTYCNTGNNQDTWYNIIYSYGGEVINEDKTASGYDKPETLEAMKFMAEKILPACPTQDAMASTGGDTMFLSGIVGMIFQGSWCINNFYTADNKDDYAWAMMPYADVNGNGQCEPEERCTIYNGLGWSAYSKTKDPAAAYSLISAFCDKDGQEMQSQLGVTMAAYKGCSDSFINAFEGMDVSAFVDIEEQGRLVFRPYSKSTGTWESEVSDALVEAWNNTDKMEEILLNCAAEMNQTISEE